MEGCGQGLRPVFDAELLQELHPGFGELIAASQVPISEAAVRFRCTRTPENPGRGDTVRTGQTGRDIENSVATEQKSDFWAEAAGSIFGLAVLIRFGGPPVVRFYRDSGGLQGPVGVGLVILAAAVLFVLAFFVMGWAFRKGWGAADDR